jgi:hypothetical protein
MTFDELAGYVGGRRSAGRKSTVLGWSPIRAGRQHGPEWPMAGGNPQERKEKISDLGSTERTGRHGPYQPTFGVGYYPSTGDRSPNHTYHQSSTSAATASTAPMSSKHEHFRTVFSRLISATAFRVVGAFEWGRFAIWCTCFVFIHSCTEQDDSGVSNDIGHPPSANVH